MSQMNIENAEFLERAEALLKDLRSSQEEVLRAKAWFIRAAIAFFAASFTLIGSVAVMNNKLNINSELISKAASRTGVIHLVDIHQAEVQAITNLIDNPDTKKAVQEIQKIVERVNGDIFMYSLQVNRGSKTNGGKN